ncbi:MAG TPA: hypothetical protein VGT98_03375 [Candidatus Elarobacter sp.]|nr:hypothetical protein [Candidatus Elarobacter sp.]
MLTYTELVTLERSLRGAHVLSVYLDGSETDPAEQRAWRVKLDHALDALRAELASSSHEERESFAAAVRLLDHALDELGAAVGAPGWAAFITAESIRYAELVRAPMPTLATWRMSATVAPYIRALKESRPAIVAVMDARKAAVYRYRFGQLDHIETLRAHHVVEPPLHMGDAPRVGFHPGTRGSTGRDATERAELEGMQRMLAELAERMQAHAGADGWILLGGIERVVAQAMHLLAPVASRVGTFESLDVHASPAAIADAARAGASALRDVSDARQIDEISAQADAGALGVVGSAATERALELSCVNAMYLSPRYLADHAADAEEEVHRAFDQDALVEDVSRVAADRLDQRGGIAARLRYRPNIGAGDVLSSPSLESSADAAPPP